MYAGSFMTVNCTIQLSSAVDSYVTVTTVWKKNSALLTSSASRTLLDAVFIDDLSLYVAQVVFSPVQLSSDDGVYACEVSVDAKLDDFVVGTETTESSNISIQARCKRFFKKGALSWHQSLCNLAVCSRTTK